MPLRVMPIGSCSPRFQMAFARHSEICLSQFEIPEIVRHIEGKHQKVRATQVVWHIQFMIVGANAVGTE